MELATETTSVDAVEAEYDASSLFEAPIGVSASLLGLGWQRMPSRPGRANRAWQLRAAKVTDPQNI